MTIQPYEYSDALPEVLAREMALALYLRWPENRLTKEELHQGIAFILNAAETSILRTGGLVFEAEVERPAPVELLYVKDSADKVLFFDAATTEE